MHPRRYEIGSDGRVVLTGLNSDETLEFELLDQSISVDDDHEGSTGQPPVGRLLNWLELYHKQYEAANRASLESDTVFAIDPPPPRTVRFDRPSPARSHFQTAPRARPPQLKFVAMVMAGIVILFVAGVTLIM